MFFDNASGLLRVVVVGVIAYVALIAILRISGKRTLAKMNAFDLVVTVALGSTLATMLLTSNVALLEGVLGLALLILMQFAIAALSMRFPLVEGLAKSTPRALLVNGRIDHDALHAERVTRDEVLAAVRSAGHGDLAAIAAVVLETNGTLSVIAQSRAGDRSALPMIDADA